MHNSTNTFMLLVFVCVVRIGSFYSIFSFRWIIIFFLLLILLFVLLFTAPDYRFGISRLFLLMRKSSHTDNFLTLLRKNWWNELIWVTGHCNRGAVSRNRYGVEKTVDTHKILINAIKCYVFVLKKYDTQTMCEVLWRNISDFYVNLRVEVGKHSQVILAMYFYLRQE